MEIKLTKIDNNFVIIESGQEKEPDTSLNSNNMIQKDRGKSRVTFMEEEKLETGSKSQIGSENGDSPQKRTMSEFITEIDEKEEQNE